MAQTHLIAVPNRDLLTSFAFNYYGTRLAASSLDHQIYVLSSDTTTGAWPEDDGEDNADVEDAGQKLLQVDGKAGVKANLDVRAQVEIAPSGPRARPGTSGKKLSATLAGGGLDSRPRSSASPCATVRADGAAP